MILVAIKKISIKYISESRTSAELAWKVLPLPRGISPGCWMESGARLSDLLLSSGGPLEIYGAPQLAMTLWNISLHYFQWKLQLCVLMLERQV